MTANAISGLLAPAADRSGPAAPPEPLYAVTLKELWRAFRSQPVSFQLACLYTMFEYVRPQQIYTFLAVIPWGQILLIGTPLAYLIEQGGGLRSKSPVNRAMVVFSLVLLVSCFLAIYPNDAFKKIDLYGNWVIAYIVIANTAISERAWLTFCILFLAWSAKMSQHGFRGWMQNGFGFSSWGVTGAPGWFQNSGEFAIQMCIFFPLSLYFFFALRRYWPRWKQLVALALPVTAVASIIASSSRGALIGLALVGLWMLGRAKHRLRTLVGVAVAAAAIWAVVPAKQKERFSEAGDDQTSTSRIEYWKAGIQITEEHPAFGIGYQNWLRYYYVKFNDMKAGALPHNIFIQASAELGLVGLAALLGLMGTTFYSNYRTRRMMAPLGERGRFIFLMAYGLDGALIGFIGSAFFITVLYYPYLWFNLAMTTGLQTAAAALVREVGRQSLAGGPATPASGPTLPQRGQAGWRTVRSGTPLVARQVQTR